MDVPTYVDCPGEQLRQLYSCCPGGAAGILEGPVLSWEGGGAVTPRLRAGEMVVPMADSWSSWAYEGRPRALSQCLRLLVGAPSKFVAKVALVSDKGALGTELRRSSRANLKEATVKHFPAMPSMQSFPDDHC